MICWILDGQCALVTGAGQGAGRGIALTLARHNAGGVAVNDFVLERAEAVAAEIESLGVRAVAVQADVGDHASVTAAFQKARTALGPITILVNNAAMRAPASQWATLRFLWETAPAEWERFFPDQSAGRHELLPRGTPEMVALKRGRIVTIVSDAGRVGDARLAAYGASKAGAAGLSAANRQGGRTLRHYVQLHFPFHS